MLAVQLITTDSSEAAGPITQQHASRCQYSRQLGPVRQKGSQRMMERFVPPGVPAGGYIQSVQLDVPAPCSLVKQQYVIHRSNSSRPTSFQIVVKSVQQ